MIRVIFLFTVLVFPAAPQNGREIFDGKGKCANCHSVSNRGGSFGPDLSDVGLRRSPESLRLSLVDPDAEIYQEYLTVVLTTKKGRRIEGVGLNEDDISIQIREVDGSPRSFLKDQLVSIRREERSLMPSYEKSLSSSEIDQLVAWLRSLRGESEPVRESTGNRAPGILTKDTAWLDRANRDGQERPDTLIRNLAIVPGSTIADVGSGTGYFTWRLAEATGARGKVIAVDVQQPMLEKTKASVRRHGVTNVTFTLGTSENPHLPGRGVDLIFVANAYHEFARPEDMLASFRRALAPAGRLIVIEYAEEKDEDPTVGREGMTLKQLRSEIEAAGFRLDRILDFLPMQHGLVFTQEQ